MKFFPFERKFFNLFIFFFIGIISLVATIAILTQRFNLQKKAAVIMDNATLNFNKSSVTTNVGTNFTVSVSVNTSAASIRGVDVMLTFDRTKLELVNISPDSDTKNNTSLKTFVPVTADDSGTFDVQRVKDRANTQGVIEFGAVTFNYQQSETIPPAFKGIADLASLTFKPLTTVETTAVNFNYTSGSTTDSNIVTDSDPPQDILNEVINLTVKINPGSETTPTRTPTPTSPPDENCQCLSSKCNSNCSIYNTANFPCGQANHCQRPDRTKGDADGKDGVTLVDYDYYRRTVLFDTNIPAYVNSDFNGDGEVGTQDGQIVLRTLGIIQ